MRACAWILLAVAATSCYRPRSPAACHAVCNFNGDRVCPGELECLADGRCHDPGDSVCPDDGPRDVNFMFVTADEYPIATMADVAIADGFCQDATDRASLGGTYRAYLATATQSASARLSGARGWVRPDHRPFAATVADIVAGRILYPPRIDERGDDHADGTFLVATGSTASGDLAGNCLNFTSDGDGLMIEVGRPDATTSSWSSSQSHPCSRGSFHLYCFGIDRRGDLPAAATGKLAFVTDTPFQPGGGIAKADELCNSEARSASFSGTFAAMLATSAQTMIEHVGGTGPWVRVDGVALGSLDAPDAPLNVTQTGKYLAGATWTGAASPSNPASLTCADWTDMGAGAIGELQRSNENLFYYSGGTMVCGGSLPLRCLER